MCYNWRGQNERGKCMSLPKDPFMLLSYINTQLRDNYASLTELASSLGEDEEAIKAALENAGFEYNSELNRFAAK